MMVNCPKCGFSQPEDQYCAKCGVDMIAFRPAEKPLLTRLASNTSLQVSILILFALAGGLYVREANRAKLARTIAETPIARDAEEQEEELAALQAEAKKAQMNQQTVSASISEPKTAAAPAKEEAEGVVTAAAVGIGTTSPATQVVGTSAAATIVPKSAVPKTIRVYYIEGDRAFFANLMSQARQGADGTYAFGVVNNIDSRMKPSHAWHSLDSSGDQPLQLNQPNVVFKGLRDPQTGQNIGFNLQVTPVSQDENGTHLQVEANRVLRDQSGGYEAFDFQLPGSFTLKPGSAFIIAGALPHPRSLTEPDMRLYRNSAVLKAMTDPAFRADVQDSPDVAIVIEAH